MSSSKFKKKSKFAKISPKNTIGDTISNDKWGLSKCLKGISCQNNKIIRKLKGDIPQLEKNHHTKFIAHKSNSTKNNLKHFSSLTTETTSMEHPTESPSHITTAATISTVSLHQIDDGNNINTTASCEFPRQEVSLSQQCSTSTTINLVSDSDDEEQCSNNFEQYRLDVESEKSRLSAFRNWQETKFGNSNNTNNINDSTVFTVLSYNILAQRLLEYHAYLYSRNDPRALPWSHRVARLLDEIGNMNAEIICLQELQNEHVNQVSSQLECLNYAFIYKKRTGSHLDGSAIFYRKDLFTMVDHKLVEYFRPHNEILSRDNVGVIAKFKVNHWNTDENNRNMIVIATTHLLYNPKRSDVRLAQVKLMLAELDKMAYIGQNTDDLPEYLPIILTGDFNFQPNTAVYNLLTHGVLDYASLSERVLNQTQHGRKQGLHLAPLAAGVTDTCQFIDQFVTRNKGKLFVDHTTIPRALDSQNYEVPEDMQNFFNSGVLCHALNLKSAYYHRTKKGQTEASTYQGDWITVDYIFFSRVFNARLERPIEARLKLLSRFCLPTARDCVCMGPIPNLFYGSDHLALAAKFMLKR